MPKHPRLTKAALQEAIVEASRCVSSRRHVLEPIEPPPDTRRPEFGSLLFQRCLVCGTLAWDKVSRLTGERIANRQYDKPYWYEQALKEGHDPAWWRATYWDTLGDEYFLEPEKVVPIRKQKKAG